MHLPTIICVVWAQEHHTNLTEEGTQICVFPSLHSLGQTTISSSLPSGASQSPMAPQIQNLTFVFFYQRILEENVSQRVCGNALKWNAFLDGPEHLMVVMPFSNHQRLCHTVSNSFDTFVFVTNARKLLLDGAIISEGRGRPLQFKKRSCATKRTNWIYGLPHSPDWPKKVLQLMKAWHDLPRWYPKYKWNIIASEEPDRNITDLLNKKTILRKSSFFLKNTTWEAATLAENNWRRTHLSLENVCLVCKSGLGFLDCKFSPVKMLSERAHPATGSCWKKNQGTTRSCLKKKSRNSHWVLFEKQILVFPLQSRNRKLPYISTHPPFFSPSPRLSCEAVLRRTSCCLMAW